MPSESETPSSREAPGASGLVDISEVAKLKLRVARVIEAERVEKADRLLKLQVDLGGETRQVVAGIEIERHHVVPREWISKGSWPASFRSHQSTVAWRLFR